jgi:predicted N-formylglutamate amidohydrolase
MVARLSTEYQKKPVVIVTDCSGAIPEQYHQMTLGDQQLQYVQAALSELELVHHKLVQEAQGAGVLPSVSKVIIDVHENIDSPKLFMQQYGDMIIMDNMNLNEEEENFRIEEFYIEYHAALRRVLYATTEEYGRAFLLFLKKIPQFHKGQEVPYDIGIVTQSSFTFVKTLEKNLPQYRVQQNPGLFFYETLHGPLQDCFEHGKVIAAAVLINEKIIRTDQMKEQLAIDIATALEAALPELKVVR